MEYQQPYQNRSRPGPGEPKAEHWLRMQYDFPPTQWAIDAVVRTLLRIPDVSAQTPYRFANIDKPQDGDSHVIFVLPSMVQFPPDGIRYLEPQNRAHLNPGPGLELEILENKAGFVPGGVDHSAWRTRRIYRLSKGGHPSIALVAYSRGNPPYPAVPPHIMNQPVRSYPLRESHEYPVFVLGENMGKKVVPPGHPEYIPFSGVAGSLQASMTSMAPGAIPGVMGGGRAAQIQAVAAQNAAMTHQIDRRREVRHPQGVPPAAQEEDDEVYVTTRGLALARFKRNHDYLAQVFSPTSITEIPDSELLSATLPSSEELQKTLDSLLSDISDLEKQKLERQQTRSSDTNDQVIPAVDPSAMTMDIS